MTMASGLYVPIFRDVVKTTPLVLNLTLSTNKVDLYLDAKTPAFDTDAAYSNVSEVATATGYTRDTMTVGGTPTFVSSGADGILKYTWSTTVQWTTATFTARGMILHAAAGNYPFCAVTFGADYTCTNGTFTITAAAGGIFSIDMVP